MFAGYHQPNNYAQGGLDNFNLLKDPTQLHQGYQLGSEKFYNFTCGRIDLMGNIVTKASPYLYPFVIEFSLIIAAILLVMWLRIGKNPRWGDSSKFPRCPLCPMAMSCLDLFPSLVICFSVFKSRLEVRPFFRVPY